ncbi:uncharacterized protein LOC112555163 [Pomacea canaliculata]|uniref:uncharacterized protein LOC112555163 n=1 Tax=Pomacea canaliculata TaxID=400727 RepID=UPI000D73ADFD|nr:uncharacterized protein LOC112555163 [Pomacea canaliculata]
MTVLQCFTSRKVSLVLVGIGMLTGCLAAYLPADSARAVRVEDAAGARHIRSLETAAVDAVQAVEDEDSSDEDDNDEVMEELVQTLEELSQAERRRPGRLQREAGRVAGGDRGAGRIHPRQCC